MTYAATVMWVWVLALVATLVAFATAWRSLVRAEGALRTLRPPAQVGAEIDASRTEVDGAAAAAGAGREALLSRPVVDPS